MPTLFAHPASHSLPPPRVAAVGACVLLAALVNAFALGLAGRLSAPGAPVSSAAHATPMHARVVVYSPLPPVEPPVAARPPRRAEARPSAPAAAPPPVLHVPGPAAPSSLADGERASGDPQSWRLYGFDEVDKAAEPEDEWSLDIAALDAAGLSRLAFELMVDARGTVIACTVIDPAGLDDAVRADLERRLASTPLRPAERAGRAVASVRRIDMRVEAAD